MITDLCKTMPSGLIGMMVMMPAAAMATVTDPGTANEEIIVTGSKTTKSAIADIINITISRPQGGRHVGQHARLSAPICPKIVGLSETNKQQVEKRMRGVALAADLRVASEKCKPNILVVIVENGDEAVSTLRQKRSRLFGTMPHYERARLAASKGPAFAWKRVQAMSAETSALHNPDETKILPSDEPAKTEAPVMISNVKSKIKRTTQMSVTHSFLLLEKDALAGLTTVQIADYAAMRTLLDIQDSNTDEMPVNSILTLFDQGDDRELAPQSVSEMDLMLLSSLYNTASDVSASIQTSAMASRIASEIGQGVED